MSEWQPIETAPIQEFKPDLWYTNHSPYVLVWDGHNCVIASYQYTSKGKGRWIAHGRIWGGISHWQPLPERPK